jgi:hypothetical protein
METGESTAPSPYPRETRVTHNRHREVRSTARVGQGCVKVAVLPSRKHTTLPIIQNLQTSSPRARLTYGLCSRLKRSMRARRSAKPNSLSAMAVARQLSPEAISAFPRRLGSAQNSTR